MTHYWIVFAAGRDSERFLTESAANVRANALRLHGIAAIVRGVGF